MKFIFSLLLVSSLQAREIISIHHPLERIEDAKFVAQTLQHQMALPANFIQLNATPCKHKELTVATICIQASGEIEVAQVKVEVMQKMLKAFGDVYETP